MDKSEDREIEIRNSFSLVKLIEGNITVLDLSAANIYNFDESVKLPAKLIQLNLSKNKLTEVPVTVLNLENIQDLDLSHNNIRFFDTTPRFCHTIEKLNISNNDLFGPPYWIWTETPKNLTEINLSCNTNITKSFINGYYEELLEYKVLVTNIKIYNCRLRNYSDILGTFLKAKYLDIGTKDMSFLSANIVEEVPCKGLDKCCDIEYLNLSNTNIYNLNSNIPIYKNLKEIILSHNKLVCLPDEFCYLKNLVICVLSYNNLYYLPDNFCTLKNIVNLLLDSNYLSKLPEGLCKLPHIKQLDLYDNELYEVPDGFDIVPEIDLAQNYFDEPNGEEYKQRKGKIREYSPDRYNGRKIEEVISESEHSKQTTDDELLWNTKSYEKETHDRILSSPEEWDSDEYWIPHISQHASPPQSPWLFFVKRKMSEGNFCPMDAHSIPIADRVRYQNMCYPKEEYESDGQFDDFSDDDS